MLWDFSTELFKIITGKKIISEKISTHFITKRYRNLWSKKNYLELSKSFLTHICLKQWGWIWVSMFWGQVIKIRSIELVVDYKKALILVRHQKVWQQVNICSIAFFLFLALHFRIRNIFTISFFMLQIQNICILLEEKELLQH